MQNDDVIQNAIKTKASLRKDLYNDESHQKRIYGIKQSVERIKENVLYVKEFTALAKEYLKLFYIITIPSLVFVILLLCLSGGDVIGESLIGKVVIKVFTVLNDKTDKIINAFTTISDFSWRSQIIYGSVIVSYFISSIFRKK